MMQSDSARFPLPSENLLDGLFPPRTACPASLLLPGMKTVIARGHVPAFDWLCAQAEAARRGMPAPDGVDEAKFGPMRDPLSARLSVQGLPEWALDPDWFVSVFGKGGRCCGRASTVEAGTDGSGRAPSRAFGTGDRMISGSAIACLQNQ